jgi:hypothetical protein
MNLRERQIIAGLLNLSIQDVHVAEELVAPYLEPTDIIRMIDNTHSIGIRVDDPDLNGSFF